MDSSRQSLLQPKEALLDQGLDLLVAFSALCSQCVPSVRAQSIFGSQCLRYMDVGYCNEVRRIVMSGDPVVVIIGSDGKGVKALTPVGIGYGVWDGYAMQSSDAPKALFR